MPTMEAAATVLKQFAVPFEARVLSAHRTPAAMADYAETARERGLTVVSFTGKSPHNPLRRLSDIGFWIDSAAYNVVECTHMLWICTVVDMVVGEAEYSVT